MMDERILKDELATAALGADLALALQGEGAVVFLSGELGAGKTTLVRGLLHEAGHGGAVKSPTYTLVEPYELPTGRVLHLDLYRIAGAADIEALGLREELGGGVLVLIEWPERAAGGLPEPDLEILLSHHPEGRVARMKAGSTLGRDLIAKVFASS